MKGVMPSVPEHILEWRRRTGADRYDEMWEGVLHMPPMPTGEHHDFQWSLETYLRAHWAKPIRGKVRCMNVTPPGGWPNNYRIPDLILWTADRDPLDKNTCFEGAPNVAVEIRSPDDESYEKLEFYAKLGVDEVWIIDCDTKEPEIYALKGKDYELKALDAEGWARSDEIGIEMRAERSRRLAIRKRGDPTSQALLPED
jgi:Uma2 family endonuclease